MAKYSTFDKVMAQLPKSPPEDVIAKIDADIVDASSEVDARLSRFALSYASNTQRFPDITDTPATPAIIEKIARYLTLEMQYIRLKEKNKSETSLAKGFADKAIQLIDDILEGKISVVVDGQAVGNQDLVGVRDPYYEDDEAIFNKTELDAHQ